MRNHLIACCLLLAPLLPTAPPAAADPDATREILRLKGLSDTLNANTGYKVTNKRCSQDPRTHRYVAEATVILTNTGNRRLPAYTAEFHVLSNDQSQRLSGDLSQPIPAMNPGQRLEVPVRIDLHATPSPEVLRGDFLIGWAPTFPLRPLDK